MCAPNITYILAYFLLLMHFFRAVCLSCSNFKTTTSPLTINIPRDFLHSTVIAENLELSDVSADSTLKLLLEGHCRSDVRNDHSVAYVMANFLQREENFEEKKLNERKTYVIKFSWS